MTASTLSMAKLWENGRNLVPYFASLGLRLSKNAGMKKKKNETGQALALITLALLSWSNIPVKIAVSRNTRRRQQGVFCCGVYFADHEKK